MCASLLTVLQRRQQGLQVGGVKRCRVGNAGVVAGIVAWILVQGWPQHCFGQRVWQGVERVELVNAWQTDPFLTVSVRPLPLPNDDGTEVEALHRSVMELIGKMLELSRHLGQFGICLRAGGYDSRPGATQ